MALDHCTSCRATEQGFKEVTIEEFVKAGFPADCFEPEDILNQACSQCGEIGSWLGVPEHDDGDMER